MYHSGKNPEIIKKMNCIYYLYSIYDKIQMIFINHMHNLRNGSLIFFY